MSWEIFTSRLEWKVAISAALLAASGGEESKTVPPWKTKMSALAGWTGAADETEWPPPPVPLGDRDLPVEVRLKKDEVAAATGLREDGGPRLAEAYRWR